MTKYLGVAACSAALLLSACLDTGPNVSFVFDVAAPDREGEVGTPLQVIEQPSRVIVEGVIQPPCAGAFLEASARRSGTDVTLRIDVDSPSACEPTDVVYEYTAMVSDLARRTHQLRIEHSHDAVRGDEYVQEEIVDLR